MPAITNKKVLVALSGGVDSSVVTHILRNKGYYVEACCMDFSPFHSKTVAAAKAVAEKLNIKLHVISCHNIFKNNVIEPFAKAYLSGITPNPCILCNQNTKFRILEDVANNLNFDFISTGHYANIEHTEDNRHLIKKAGCIKKDQSYMLYRLTQKQLSKLILPLNNMPKTEVRNLAAELNLPSANSPDSQEICFIPDNDYANFIEKNFGLSKKGYFISPNGEICGKHKGILHYTVGQRKGLGISLGYPVFIKSIDAKSGNIELARKGEEIKKAITLSNCVLLPHPSVNKNFDAEAKIRSVATPTPCKVKILEDKRLFVEFEIPQRAPAPGQSCVLYNNDYVLGGGFIE